MRVGGPEILFGGLKELKQRNRKAAALQNILKGI